MLLNINFFIKIAITTAIFFSSLYFLAFGFIFLDYKKLNNNLNTKIISDSEITMKSQNAVNEITSTQSKKADITDKQKINNLDLLENKIKTVVKKNDTFIKILKPHFNNTKTINNIINETNKQFDLKKLNVGQEIFFYKNNKEIVKKIEMPINFSTDLKILILENNIIVEKEKIEITNELQSKKYIIQSSVYEDGKNAGVPIKILSDAIRLYSFDIDFQRDIQKDDKLELLYEIYFNKKRNTTSFGDIKYIKLYLRKNHLEYFAFKTNEGFIDYFNNEGKNVKKALLKTPIDGARLSSTYGMRKHPISGYNKMHRGVDFAAPIGTPIYAGGNGTIEFFGRNGGYGKYIRIRHNNNYKTAYAHLNSYKKGIYKGLRVKQGDIIGYVGSTGKSTGPHLHYEIIYKNKQINPMTMKLPSGKVLKDKELDRFKKEANNIYSNFLFNLYE